METLLDFHDFQTTGNILSTSDVSYGNYSNYLLTHIVIDCGTWMSRREPIPTWPRDEAYTVK